MTKSQPPKWASRFLEWYCKSELIEEIEGDIYELFNRRIQKGSHLIASLLFIIDVFRFFKPGNIRLSSNFKFLLLHYHFKIASRSLIKNKTASFINIFGLTVGLFASTILLLYVEYEYSYDSQHQQALNIYRLVHTKIIDDKEAYKKASVYPELGIELEAKLSSIKTSARLFPVAAEFHPIFIYEKEPGLKSQFTETNIFLTDSTFTNIFDFTWINGTGNNALNTPNNLVISESLAMRVFGSTDVAGKSLIWKGMDEWEIAGVFADWPANSHIHFDILASWVQVYGERSLKRWDGFYTYLLTHPIKDIQQFSDEIATLSSTYLSNQAGDQSVKSRIEVQPLSDIHLKSHLSNELGNNGNEEVVKGLLIMAFAILIIAIFNFINISSSYAIRRAKEVGIRKLIGSRSDQICSQYLIESFCMVLVAHLITLFLLHLCMPLFNNWIGTDIKFSQWLLNVDFWALFFISLFTITLLSGGYPAFILARFKALGLVTKSKTLKSNSFRSILTGFQFSIAILFTILAVIAFFQIDYITNKNLGFNKDILVLNSMEIISDHNDTTFVSKMEVLKNKLKSFQGIGEATLTSHIPGIINNWVGQAGSTSGDKLVNSERVRIDRDFIKTYDLKLLAGRFYVQKDEEHPLEQIVINRAMAETLGFDNPSDAIGHKLGVFNGAVPIIGIIENFHSQSPKQKIMPALYTLGPGHKSFLSIKINSDQKEQNVKIARDTWKDLFPERPFDYFFIEDQMNKQFLADNRLISALRNFALLAIGLACLGLFGISNFMVSIKRKEIGIRRIFGATYTHVLYLLSKKQLLIAMASFVLVTPLAWFVAENWLSQYAYKISLDVWFFLLPFLSFLTLALGTIAVTIVKQRKENTIHILEQ